MKLRCKLLSANNMAGVIMWRFVLIALLHSGLTDELDCYAESALGKVAVYDRGKEATIGSNQGTVVVCVMNSTRHYVKAALCYDDKVNEPAGNAACRQLGFAEIHKLQNSENFGIPPDIDAVITNIQCPKVKNYSTQGEINLLRCLESYHITTPDCNSYAAVVCSRTPLKIGDPYNGQVYIEKVKDVDYLYINYSGEALPVCADGYTNATLNSICQQMGYTEVCSSCLNVRPIDPGTEPDSDFWYLGNVACNDGPYPCFTDCFDASNITTVSSCKQRLSLFCIYNESNAAVAGSGNKGICGIDVPEPPANQCASQQQAINGLIAGLVVAIVIIIISCMIHCRVPIRYLGRNICGCLHTLYQKVKGYNGIPGSNRGSNTHTQAEPERNAGGSDNGDQV